MEGASKSDVLLVCTALVPGIAERSAVLLGRALMSRGYKVSALLRDPLPNKELASKFRIAKIPVHTSPHLCMAGGIGRMLTVVSLARKIKQYAPRAVSIHVPGIGIHGSDVAAARMAGVKRVVASVYPTTEALETPEEGKRSPLNILDAVIVSSPGMEAGMMSTGVSEGKIRMIASPLELPPAGTDRRPARNRLRVPSRGFAVGTACRLTRDHHVDQIIRACASSPGFKRLGWLVVAGDGPERQRLAVMAADLLPSQHLFLGSLPDPSALFAGIDLFMFASEPEEFGRIFSEAGAWWTPSLAVDVGATQYVIEDGRNGLLTPKDHPEEMSAKLDFLIKDRAVLAQMGQRARQLSETAYNPEKIADAYEDLLHLKHK